MVALAEAERRLLTWAEMTTISDARDAIRALDARALDARAAALRRSIP